MAYPRVVRIRNDGNSIFTGKWAGEKYTVPPGSETLVEWDAICNWFGHPDAIDVPGDRRKRYRTDELHRLFVKYGIYENHHLQEERFPKVSVWDLTNPSHRYITVIDDPEGKNLTPETRTIAENQNLSEQVRLMGEQLAFLQAQLAQKNNDNPNPLPQPSIGDESVVAPENRPEFATDHDSSLVDDAEVDMPIRPKAVARA